MWLARKIRRFLREVLIYFQFLKYWAVRPVIFFNPCDSVSGWGSDLRAKRISPILREKYSVNSIYLPAQLSNSQRKRIAKIISPDVVIHQTFMNEKANPKHFPYAINIIDLDDAHFNDPILREHFIEKVKVTDAGIAGSRYVKNWLNQYLNVTKLLWTPSSSIPTALEAPEGKSDNTLVWATTRPLINYPEEAEFLLKVLIKVAEKRAFKLHVIGEADSHQLNSFFGQLLEHNCTLVHSAHLPYDRFLDLLKKDTIGLAPLIPDDFKIGKSFGKIIAYISSGLPVVTSDVADHPIFFDHGANGFISNNIDIWVTSILRLLESKELRRNMAEVALADMQEKLNSEHFCDGLMEIVNQTLAVKHSVIQGTVSRV